MQPADTQSILLKRAERKRKRKLNKVEKKKAYLAFITTQGLFQTDTGLTKQKIVFSVTKTNPNLITQDGHQISIHFPQQTTGDDVPNVELTTNIPHLNHLDWFWSIVVPKKAGMLEQQSARLSLLWEAFPNLKEVSESVCAFRTIALRRPEIQLQTNSKTVLVIGDGTLPRTAMLFSELLLYNNNKKGVSTDTSTTIVSIDPTLRMNCAQNIFNHFQLVLFPTTVEEWIHSDVGKWICSSESNCIYIIYMHSHTRFKNFIKNLLRYIHPHCDIVIFAMKCCGVHQSLSPQQLSTYELTETVHMFDWGVFSSYRECHVWQRTVEPTLKTVLWEKNQYAIKRLIDVYYFLKHTCYIAECCVDIIVTYYLPGVCLSYSSGMFVKFGNIMDIVLNGHQDGKHFQKNVADVVYSHYRQNLLFLTYENKLLNEKDECLYAWNVFIQQLTLYKESDIIYGISDTFKLFPMDIVTKYAHWPSVRMLPDKRNLIFSPVIGKLFLFVILSETETTTDIGIAMQQSICDYEILTTKSFLKSEICEWFVMYKNKPQFGFVVSDEWVIISSFYVIFAYHIQTKAWHTQYYEDDSNLFDRCTPMLMDNFVAFFTKARNNENSLIETSIYDLFAVRQHYPKAPTQRHLDSSSVTFYHLKKAVSIS